MSIYIEEKLLDEAHWSKFKAGDIVMYNCDFHLFKAKVIGLYENKRWVLLDKITGDDDIYWSTSDMYLTKITVNNTIGGKLL